MIRGAAVAATATLAVGVLLNTGAAAGERSTHVEVIGASHAYTQTREAAATAASRSAERSPIPKPVHIDKPVPPPPPPPPDPEPVTPDTPVTPVAPVTPAEPVAPVGDASSLPEPWRSLAMCESGLNPRAYNPAGPYMGLFQFLQSTWESVGGVGDPRDASVAEQLHRAQILQARSGWSQWTCAAGY